MTFKPPYWHHDNIKFADEDIKILKSEMSNKSEFLSKNDPMKDQVTTFYVDQRIRTEKKFNSRYDQIVEDIVKNVGLYRMVKYEYQYWAQLYLQNHKHTPHQHSRKIHEEPRKWEEVIMSWVHFLDVPKQKCFRFLDNDGNFLVPNEQSSGDLIVFPSWVWHEVLPNKSNQERIVISGNISVTYYDDFN